MAAVNVVFEEKEKRRKKKVKAGPTTRPKTGVALNLKEKMEWPAATFGGAGAPPAAPSPSAWALARCARHT